MIKAIFFDIDGTLVSFDTHCMHDSTPAALVELRRRGIKIFICTGRHELLIDNVDTSLFDGIVSLNGQCVRVGKEIIYTNAMSAGDAEAAVRFAQERGISTIFEGEDFIKMNCITDMTIQGAALINLPIPKTEDISRIAEHPILQLIMFCTQDEEREILKYMPSCESTRWTHLLCDIIPRGGGKHIGIQKVLDHYGFTREESMAFGDGDNDRTMLQYAGVGVAMENAPDEVKACADYITPHTDKEGIVKALSAFGVI